MQPSRNAAIAGGPNFVRRGGAWRAAAIVLSLVIAAFGLVLLGGGVWLIALGGSWYYGLAGAGLLATAVLLFKQQITALYVYLVVWALTLVWALWEVGLNPWAQVPRLVAPTVVLILILAILPALRPARTEETHA
jgi:quinoprotein glucose dehydrogenase